MKNLCLCCAICCLIAILKLPIGYYSFLRILVSAGALYLFIREIRANNKLIWITALAVITIFNPVYPLFLYKKTYWFPLDILAAVFFLYGYFQNNLKGHSNAEELETGRINKYQRDKTIK